MTRSDTLVVALVRPGRRLDGAVVVTARPTRGGVVGRAGAIPCRDACFDRVLVVDYPPTAAHVQEVARVARPAATVEWELPGPEAERLMRQVLGASAGPSWDTADLERAFTVLEDRTERVDRNPMAELQRRRAELEPRLSGFGGWTVVMARAQAVPDPAVDIRRVVARR